MVPITILRSHKKQIENTLKKLFQKNKKDGFPRDQIIVDKNTMIVLDGYHRLEL